MRISAILLAAGRSERMGAQKALLPWAGSTLLAYQLAQLAAPPEVTEIVVVTGDAADELTPLIEAAPKARAAHNADYAASKAGSVRCGLAALDGACDAVLLLAVDQPRPAALLQTLIDAHRRVRASITAPLVEGHRGHPLIFDRALLSELLAIDDATLGVRAVVGRHASELNAVTVESPIARLDLNTPEDVERGRRMIDEGSGA